MGSRFSKDLARSNRTYSMKGFTLMELIIVIIILGVMAVGLGGFIGLSTQTYVNVTERDELISTVRFSVERLNREIRNAVPNSFRVAVDSATNPTKQCLEFVPITASTIYTEIATVPEPKSDKVTVIPFLAESGNSYSCNECGDKMVVYPLSPNDVYENHDVDLNKVFTIDEYVETGIADQTATITLVGAGVNFAEDSPTSRTFIFNQAVSYCVENTTIVRYSGYTFSDTQLLPPFISTGTSSLMAENVTFDPTALPFSILPASLQRNAVVQVVLSFSRDGEQITFDNATHVSNIP